MALNMARPTKHPRTGIYRVRVAIPAKLRDTTARLFAASHELTENLGTRDPAEAMAAGPAALVRLKAMLKAAQATLDSGTANLSDRDVHALAGEFYRREVAAVGDNPRRVDWASRADALLEQVDGDDEGHWVSLSPDDKQDASALLAARGLPADPTTVRRLGEAVFEAKLDAARLLERRAAGDWSPDTREASIPTPSPALAKPGTRPAAVASLDALLQGFAADKGWGRLDAVPIPRPLYDRKRTLARLADFMGHTDAAKVSKADAVRWKEDMQARGLHASTVRNDLSECSAVWKWAARNGKLPASAVNPFDGISPPKAAKRKREARAFTDDEATTILTAARGQTGVLRWLPWVCCLTGSRLAEVSQSVKEDVATVAGVLAIRIHDDGEGRSVKNDDSRRTVPIHPALITEGFVDYVASLPAGSPLFPDVKPDALFGLRSTEAGRKVGRWLRTLGISDPRISPSHSWRHWFIDACRQVSMPIEVRSALTGHSARMDESAGYGAGVGSLLGVMAAHLAKVALPPALAFQGRKVPVDPGADLAA